MSAADFEKAVAYVRNPSAAGGVEPPALNNETKLQFYGLYKQATEGDVTAAKPSVFQMEARAKHSAWEANKGMSANEAKQKYVELANSSLPNWNK